MRIIGSSVALSIGVIGIISPLLKKSPVNPHSSGYRKARRFKLIQLIAAVVLTGYGALILFE